MFEYQGIHDIIVDPDNPDELLLDLGVEVCERLGWKPGDTVEWVNNKDGSWRLKKVLAQTP
jgi:hypothetical protein